MAHAVGVDVEVVRDRAALDALEPAWTALHDAARRTTPFQSPAWVLPWLDQFGTGDLLAIVARERGALAALAPLLIRRDAGVGRVVFAGDGTTDYQDAVYAEPVAASLPALILDVLRAIPDRWGAIDLRRIPPHSPLAAGAMEGIPAVPVTTEDEPCPGVDLTGGFDGVLDRAGARFARNLRYAWRLAGRLGTAVLEPVRGRDVGTAFEELCVLHARRWQRRGEPGVLADPRVVAMHRAALPRLDAAGLARLVRFRLGETTVGVYYGLARGTTHYAYLSGIDPAYPAIGIGHHLHAEAMRRAIAEGATRFDFLRGAEAYKYRWGAIDGPAFRLSIARDGWA